MSRTKYYILMFASSFAGWAIGATIGIFLVKMFM